MNSAERWSDTTDPANDNDRLVGHRKARPEDVRALFGIVDFRRIAEILQSAPSFEDLRQVHSLLQIEPGRNRLRGMAALLEFVTQSTDPSADDLGQRGT